MGILFPDLSIRAMDNQFRTLVPGNLTGNLNCFLLCSSANSCSGVILSLYLPSTIGMRCDVLVFSHNAHLISNEWYAHSADTYRG